MILYHTLAQPRLEPALSSSTNTSYSYCVTGGSCGAPWPWPGGGGAEPVCRGPAFVAPGGGI